METRSKFHSLPAIDYSTIETLDELLEKIFSPGNDDDKNESKITEEFLAHLAYGIQSIEKYDPVNTFSHVEKKIKSLAQQFNSTRVKMSCFVFSAHFKRASSARDVSMIDSCKNPVSFKEMTDDLAASRMAHDISVMNAQAYLKLSTPVNVNDKNLLAEYFNQLCKVVSDDIKSSNNQKSRVKFYLTVADKLLNNEKLIDYHGAAAISLALRSVESKKIQNLTELYSVSNNYRNLRHKMKAKYDLALMSELKETGIISNKKNLQENRIYLSVKNKNEMSSILFSVKDVNGEIIRDNIFKDACDESLFSRLQKEILDKTLANISLDDKMALLKLIAEMGYISLTRYHCMPFFMVLSQDLVFAAENVLYDRIMVSGKIYYELNEKIGYIQKNINFMSSEYQTDLPEIINQQIPKLDEPLYTRQLRDVSEKRDGMHKRRRYSVTEKSSRHHNQFFSAPVFAKTPRNRSTDSLEPVLSAREEKSEVSGKMKHGA